MKYISRLLLFGLFVAILILVIAYARGYRLDVKKKSVTSTGIIAVDSSPKTAKIYVNGELKGVTDMNLTLPPGKYTVELKKDGYMDWKKNISLKGELVMTLEATLFPQNASLTPLTNLGVGKIISIDQTGRHILFSQTGNVEKDGIYIFDQSKRPFSLFPPLKLLILKKNLPADIDLYETKVTFSPDYKEGIFEFTVGEGTVAYDMGFDEEVKTPFDVTTSQASLSTAWKEERELEAVKILEALPKDMRAIASDSFRIVSFAPDKTKFLYEVTTKEVLPPIITPPLISANQEKEERNLIPGEFYIYDIKEDKNFHLNIKDEDFLDKSNFRPEGDQPLVDNIENYIKWYPDSQHVVLNEQTQTSVMAYDNSNKQVIYSGPHEQNFLDIALDGKLLILANLNPQTNKSPDVYAVGIR
ncbi:MAG: PEGA domain-containing protein [Patescibacteria group bacterium]